MIFGTKKKPRGPLGSWETHVFHLSGTSVQFEAPEHNHELIESRTKLDKRLNIFDESNFGRLEENDFSMPVKHRLAVKDWAFWGLPFIQGGIGDIKFHVLLYRMPEFDSLFRPRRLECAVERYIYSSGDETRRSGGNARLGWRIRELSGHRWVNYQVRCEPWINNAESVTLNIFQLPISSEHLLTFYFKQIIRAKDTELSRVFAELIRKVMSSIDLRLSEDALRQKAQAEEKFPWESLSDDIPPYDFEDPELLDEWHMFRAVSEKFGESISYDEKEQETQKRMKQQKQDAKARKDKILASHLRFDELEAADLRAYSKE